MMEVNSLKNRYIWRVGNGQNIDIWKGTWIRNYAYMKIITPRGGHLLSKVSDLIDPVTNF